MKYPVIKILTPELSLLGELDAYTSLILTRCWQGAGEFEIHAPATVSCADQLAENRIIMLDSDGRRNGIIRSLTYDEGESGVMLTARGQTLNGLAAQRYTIPKGDPYNGGYDNVPMLTAPSQTPDPLPAETVMKTYVDRHMVHPEDATRAFPNLALIPDLGRGAATVWMSRYEQLDGVLQRIGEYTDTGWQISINLQKKQLEFDVLCGTDRSISQNETSRVLFSREFESIGSLNYSRDNSNLKNVGYAGGAGEGADRIILKITNEAAEPTGLARHETFLDCGSVEITESDTAMSLSEEGKHKLLEYPMTESLTATIAPSGSFQYLEDWDLGDKVTVFSRTVGVSLDTRITEITERYEAQEFGLDVCFGVPAPDLGRIIKTFRNTVK